MTQQTYEHHSGEQHSESDERQLRRERAEPTRYVPVECPQCDGDRFFVCRTCRGNGSPGYDIYVCWACGGSGQEKCEKCNGEGVVYVEQEHRS